MPNVSRREFLAGTTFAAAAAWMGRQAPAADSAGSPPSPVKPTSGTDTVTLGKSGLRTTLLGIGTGTRGGSEQIGLGQDAFIKLIGAAYDRGIRYIDTADAYRTHLFVGMAIDKLKLPRDKLFIQTKTTAKHPEVAKADVERFIREMRVKYLDSILMHCMQKKGWITDMRPVLDVLLEAKRKGRVRAVGVSCHGYDPLVDSVDVDDLDIHLVRVNPFQQKMDAKPEDVVAQIRKMHAQNRGVIGMKIYGEGDCKTPEQRFESLKFVLGLGCVDCFTIGFSSAPQIDETLDAIKRALA
jgi:predicted aldo/keto reductase-like oxidoreductase